MSLATRCPACLTTFRVVQDQLRVSEGWVRCGRCNEVFNAVDHLVDLSRPAPPSPSAVTVHASSWPDLQRPAEHGMEPSQQAQETDFAVDVPPPAARPGEPSIECVDAAPPAELRAGAAEAPTESSSAAAEPSVPAEAATPSFVQAAERAQRWRRPSVRRTLVAAALVLGLALFAQAAMEYHDLVAARWPSTKPVLDTMCRWSGCRIEPPRWIEALTVESSGLVRVEGTSTYRFSLALRNRSAMTLALPSVDLTLTDAQGRVIARRAFLASELGSDGVTVAAGSELPLQATLAINERPVAGYTIEIFYP